MKFLRNHNLKERFLRPSRSAEASNDAASVPDEALPMGAQDYVQFFDLPEYAEFRLSQLSEYDLALIEGLRVQSEREPLNEDACAPGTLVWSVRLRHTRMVMEMLGYSTLEVNKHCSSLKIKHNVPALTLP